MKTIFKLAGFILLALLTAIVIYPLLHESGHAIIALLTGTEILDFQVLPLPLVMCKATDTEGITGVFIGMGGVVFPYILSIRFRPKQFWCWYINWMLKSVSVFAIFISTVVVILYSGGFLLKNEDVVKTLELFPNGKWLLLMALSWMGGYGVKSIAKEKPFSRCVTYVIKQENNDRAVKRV